MKTPMKKTVPTILRKPAADAPAPAKAPGKTVAAKAAPPAVTGDPKPAKAKVVKISKYKGATTGLRVMEYQDTTFAANTKAMLTDAELAELWRKEFPNAVAFTETHVGGARRDYNNGTHSKMFSRPATPLFEVIVDGGKKRFVTADESTRAKAEKVAAKVEKTRATKAAKAVKSA